MEAQFAEGDLIEEGRGVLSIGEKQHSKPMWRAPVSLGSIAEVGDSKELSTSKPNKLSSGVIDQS